MEEIRPIDNILQEYKTGNMKASKAYVLLRSLESELKDAVKEVEPGVVDELTQLSDKEDLVVMGNKISHVAGRTSYDYKQCPMYIDADKEVKRVRELIKTATKQGVEIMDKETGEVIEPVELKQGKGYLKMERA